MTERIGISLVLLLIAMAQLATDVARLILEASPRPSINEPAPAPRRSVEPEMPRPPPILEPPEQPAGLTASWAFEPPRAPPTKRTSANRMFNRLPMDYSINQPPWCLACRHRDPRRHQRWHLDEW
jgi:hypothetical protein